MIEFSRSCSSIVDYDRAILMIDEIDQIIPTMIDRDLIVPITMYGLHIFKRRKGETATTE